MNFFDNAETYNNGVAEQLIRFDSVLGEEGDADERVPEHSPGDCRPALRATEPPATEHRPVEEDRGRHRAHEEAGCQQQVGSTSLDREPDRGEQSYEQPGERRGGRQDEPQLRLVVLRTQAGIRDEERQAGAEQGREEDLPPQPRLERAAAAVHIHLVGRSSAADKRQ